MCRNMRQRVEDPDTNEITLSGKVMSNPTLYRYNGQIRSKVIVRSMTEWGQGHTFTVQVRGSMAFITVVNAFPGRRIRVTGRLRNAQGRIMIVAEDVGYEATPVSSEHLRIAANMIDGLRASAPIPADEQTGDDTPDHEMPADAEMDGEPEPDDEEEESSK